jgi:hypothetical protein
MTDPEVSEHQSGAAAAAAAAAEVGHTMGLSHDGQGTDPYYYGQGDWAPVSVKHPSTDAG